MSASFSFSYTNFLCLSLRLFSSSLPQSVFSFSPSCSLSLTYLSLLSGLFSRISFLLLCHQQNKKQQEAKRSEENRRERLTKNEEREEDKLPAALTTGERIKERVHMKEEEKQKKADIGLRRRRNQ